VLGIDQLIQLIQLTLPHLQAHGHEGILLASLGPLASAAHPARRAHFGSLLPVLSFSSCSIGLPSKYFNIYLPIY
jgi:hypothetical protein